MLWIFTGNINEMICTLAYHSPGKRQTRVLEGRLRRLAGHQRPCQLRRPVLARAVSRPGVGLCGRDKSGSLAIFDRNSAAPCDAIPPASARCAALPPVSVRQIRSSDCVGYESNFCLLYKPPVDFLRMRFASPVRRPDGFSWEATNAETVAASL